MTPDRSPAHIRTTGDGAPGDGHDSGETLDVDSEVVSYDRSPLDLFRLVVWASAAFGVAFATRYLRAGTDGLEENLSSLLTVDVGAVQVVLDVLLLAASITASLVVLIVPLVTRRFRLFGYVLSAHLLASLAIAAINAWVGDLDMVGSAISGPGDPLGLDVSTDVAAATQMVAAFVAVAPFVTSRWRHLGMWLVGALLVLRLAVAPGTSTHALLVLSTGAAIGSAVLLMWGRPATRPRASSILAALNSTGIPAVSIERAAVDARGSVPWFAEAADGSRLFVKVLGTDQRAADLLFRIYRMLRLRNVGDERPFSSLRRTVEHEALVALAARDVGVRTPRLRAMSTVGTEGFLLSYDRIGGSSLDEVDPDEITDDVLIGIWEQVAMLGDHRIAHRDLRLANVFLTPGGEPQIIDFGFSEIAAGDSLIQADLAQLLVSLALVAGVQRTTTTAIEVLGAEAVAATLGRMQPAAMSGATQASLKTRKSLLEDLRHEIESSTGVVPPPLEPITRVTPVAIAALVVMTVLVYVLAPLLADLPGLIGELRGTDPWWIVPALAATGGAFVASTVVVLGAVRSRLPVGPTLAARLATAFAGKFEPAGIGATSLELRYLERQGVDPASASQAIGFAQLAGLIAHLALTAIFGLWVARDIGSGFLASPGAALVGLASVTILGSLAMAVPVTRRAILGTALPVLSGASAGLRNQLASPGKLAWVFAGATAQRLAQILAFFYVAQAFGLTESFAGTATVYLVGAGIAALAPTPGGLGAVEAALIAGLMAIGVNSATAVPAVFLYRLITFWAPSVPGWAAFLWLRRNGRL